jgi:hypothetical protein
VKVRMNMESNCETSQEVHMRLRGVINKILESLVSGTSNKDTVTSQYLNTTPQYDSCNKASHINSHIIHLVRNIAYPSNKLL